MELGSDYFDRRNKTKVVGRLVKRLSSLGYAVTLNPIKPLEFEQVAPADPPWSLPPRFWIGLEGVFWSFAKREKGARQGGKTPGKKGSDRVKIATFNINNINKRLANLMAWLERAAPDVVCLQEMKAEQGAFPARALRAVGYEAVWEGERSWNGVAILARGRAPVLTRSSLPGDPADRQARYIEAAVNGVLVASIYLPNGNPQPGPKFVYKLAWFERLLVHAGELMKAGVPVVLAGDYNVVPTVEDIYPTRSLDGNALIQPESRRAFGRLLAQGWVDALRRVQPAGPLWTFWDYTRGRWEADKGIRLDFLLVSPELAGRVVAGGVDKWVRGEVNASDHAPVWVELE